MFVEQNLINVGTLITTFRAVRLFNVSLDPKIKQIDRKFKKPARKIFLPNHYSVKYA